MKKNVEEKIIVLISEIFMWMPFLFIVNEGISNVVLIAVGAILVIERKLRKIVLIIALLVSLVIVQWGLIQFSIQGDLNMNYIGEAKIGNEIDGIAKFGDSKTIRAYGSYIHANIFGGVLAMGLLFTNLVRKKELKETFKIISWILFLGCLISFSRSALMVAVGGIVLKENSGGYKKKNLLPIFIMMLVLSPYLIERNIDKRDMAISERYIGMQWSAELISKNMWTGVGIGNYKYELKKLLNENFIKYNEWQIDYVHSVPLLVMSEVGIVGIVIFGMIGMVGVKKWYNSRNIVMIGMTLPIILFDHYIITNSSATIFAITYLIAAAKM